MNEFTFEEMNLVCIYNSSGTREGLIAALTEMRGYLEPDEDELRSLTDSALAKLGRMTDAEFAALDLLPDFETEDPAYVNWFTGPFFYTPPSCVFTYRDAPPWRERPSIPDSCQ